MIFGGDPQSTGRIVFAIPTFRIINLLDKLGANHR
jgi:hypothetical protein